MVTPQPRKGTRLRPVLARGVLAWRAAYLAAVRRHPLLVDAALVAVLLKLSGPHFTGIRSSGQVWSVALLPALLLPLIWRRRAPFLIFLIISAAVLAQLFTSQQVTDDLAVLVAFYTIAAYEPPRRILAAAVILEAGAVLFAVQNAPAGTHAVLVWVFASGLVTAAGFIGYYVRTRRLYLTSLVDRADRLERERDREAQLAVAAERARIAREMHDIVAHNLAVMIALADGAAYTTMQDPDQAVTIMGHVSDTGRSALTEMRRLLGVMRQQNAPEHAPQPALADVDDLLATVRAAGLPARLTVSGRPFLLPPSAQLALYRMIQEALTNVLKHAAAETAQVRLSYLPGEVRLEVTDDGRPGAGHAGRQPNAGHATGQPGAVPAAGHGIAGMRERAAVFGGEVSAGPRPGGGWQVHAVLHLDPAATGNELTARTEGA